MVPLQTALALFLAMLVHTADAARPRLLPHGVLLPVGDQLGGDRVLWLFLFSTTGAVNEVLGWVGLNGPNWFQDPRGVLHLLLGGVGVDDAPSSLADHGFLGISWWDWLSGPSVAMSRSILLASFTTSGTMMLLFIAALNNIGEEIDEAGMVDGANAWQRFRHLTLPMLRPTMFTVLTLGLIGTWQVFDQIYTGTQGGPAKTTMTPAYLSFNTAFNNQNWGQGAAIAFILFAIIVVLTLVQRAAAEEQARERRREPASLAAGAVRRPGRARGPLHPAVPDRRSRRRSRPSRTRPATRSR